MRYRYIPLALVALLASSCTIRDPVGTGAVAGTLGGIAGGAIVAGSSSSVSVAQGMGYGLAIGIPAGVTLAYVSDAIGRMDGSSRRSAEIDENFEEIVVRQREIDQMRREVLAESPRGLPADYLKERVYVGPSLGNRYR